MLLFSLSAKLKDQSSQLRVESTRRGSSGEDFGAQKEIVSTEGAARTSTQLGSTEPRLGFRTNPVIYRSSHTKILFSQDP